MRKKIKLTKEEEKYLQSAKKVCKKRFKVSDKLRAEAKKYFQKNKS